MTTQYFPAVITHRDGTKTACMQGAAFDPDGGYLLRQWAASADTLEPIQLAAGDTLSRGYLTEN